MYTYKKTVFLSFPEFESTLFPKNTLTSLNRDFSVNTVLLFQTHEIDFFGKENICRQFTFSQVPFSPLVLKKMHFVFNIPDNATINIWKLGPMPNSKVELQIESLFPHANQSKYIELIIFLFFGLTAQRAVSQFPDQGLNLRPLHWKAKSQPLDHQGSP